MILPTSPVDHSKFAAQLRFGGGKERGAGWDAGVTFGLSTLTVVNPGAGPNATAPDQKEDKSGSMPVHGQAFWRPDWRLAGGEAALGIQSYFSDLSGSSASGVPVAPSMRLEWRLGTWLSARLAAGVGVPGTPIALLEHASLSARLGGGFAFTLGTEALAVQALGSSVRFVQPRVLAGVAF